MTGNDTLLKGRITRALLKFAIPVMLSSILQVLYSTVDLIIVGNFSTNADMSAVVVGSQVMMTMTLGIIGLTTGLTVLLSHFSGSGKSRESSAAIGSSIVFFAVLSIGLTALLLGFTSVIVKVMNTPPTVVKAAEAFLYISSSGTIFIVGYNVVSGIFRGLGNSKTPLIFVAVACVINVILDLILVKGFGMGATGAAIATVTAQAGSLLFSIVYIRVRNTGIDIRREDLKFRWDYIGKTLRIGMPIALQEMLISLSFLLITAVVNKMAMDNGLGPVPSAAVGTVEKIMNFLMMPTIAISMAVSTMAAYNFGADQFDRARQTLRAGILVSLGSAALFTAFCWINSTALPSLFSQDPDVIREASLYLKTYALDSLGVAFVFNFNAYFASCNRSLFSMSHSLLTTFLIRVPFVLIYGRIPGTSLFTIGFAAPLSSLASLIICVIYFIRLNRKMVADGPAFSLIK